MTTMTVLFLLSAENNLGSWHCSASRFDDQQKFDSNLFEETKHNDGCTRSRMQSVLTIFFSLRFFIRFVICHLVHVMLTLSYFFPNEWQLLPITDLTFFSLSLSTLKILNYSTLIQPKLRFGIRVSSQTLIFFQQEIQIFLIEEYDDIISSFKNNNWFGHQ